MRQGPIRNPLTPADGERFNHHVHLGEYAQAETVLRRCLAGLVADDPARIDLQRQLSQVLLRQDRVDEAVQMARDAARAAHALGDVELLVEALDARAQAHCFGDQYVDALRAIQIADDYLAQSALQAPFLLSRLAHTKGQCYKNCALWEDGEHYLRQALGIFEDLRARDDWAHTACELANLFIRQSLAQGADFEQLGKAESLLERAQAQVSNARFSLLARLDGLRLQQLMARGRAPRLRRVYHQYKEIKARHLDELAKHGLYGSWFHGAARTVCAWAESAPRDFEAWQAMLSLRTALQAPSSDERPWPAALELARVRLVEAHVGAEAQDALLVAGACMVQCATAVEAELTDVSRRASSDVLSGMIGHFSDVLESMAGVAELSARLEATPWPLATRMIELIQPLRVQHRLELLRRLPSPSANANANAGTTMRDFTDRIRVLHRLQAGSAPDEAAFAQFPEYRDLRRESDIEQELAYCRRELSNSSRAHAVMRPDSGGGPHGIASDRGLHRAVPVKLQSLQARLRDTEIILDYYVGPDKAYASVVGRDDCHIIRLHDLVPGELMRLCKKRFSPRWGVEESYRYLAHAMDQLGQTLFPKPLLDLLEKSDTIFIVPSGALWRVPFGWLQIGQRRLFERWKMCYVPAARFAGSALPAPTREGRSSYVGGFKGSSTAISLAGVDAELSRIAEQLQCEVDNEATPRRVLQALADADLVHLGCHGAYDEISPLLSSLNLCPDDLHVDGRLYLLEVLRSGIRASVVNLAACYTAEMGSSLTLPETYANAVLGAGARFVIASLWEADDEQCELFSGYFYEATAEGQHPIEAFHTAQIRQLHESAALASDYQWSPDQQVVHLANLVLIGATSDDGRAESDSQSPKSSSQVFSLSK